MKRKTESILVRIAEIVLFPFALLAIGLVLGLLYLALVPLALVLAVWELLTGR